MWGALELIEATDVAGANTFTNNVCTGIEESQQGQQDITFVNGLFMMNGARDITSIGNTFTANTGVTFFVLDNERRDNSMVDTDLHDDEAYNFSSYQDKVNQATDTFLVTKYSRLA